jgi:hypothetical protein
MVSAPNVIREGDGDRIRLRTGQMRSIASGMGGSSARDAVLPSMRFAYGPLVLPDEGCTHWQSVAIRCNQVQSGASRGGWTASEQNGCRHRPQPRWRRQRRANAEANAANECIGAGAGSGR